MLKPAVEVVSIVSELSYDPIDDARDILSFFPPLPTPVPTSKSMLETLRIKSPAPLRFLFFLRIDLIVKADIKIIIPMIC